MTAQAQIEQAQQDLEQAQKRLEEAKKQMEQESLEEAMKKLPDPTGDWEYTGEYRTPRDGEFFLPFWAASRERGFSAVDWGYNPDFHGGQRWILRKRPETHAEAMDRLNPKPGEYFKILRTAEDYERGWKDAWVTPMTDAVGKVGRVKYPPSSDGVYLEVEGVDGLYEYPAFVLERVDPPLPEDLDFIEAVKYIYDNPGVYAEVSSGNGLDLFPPAGRYPSRHIKVDTVQLEVGISRNTATSRFNIVKIKESK